jgi:hypothetical protein
MEKSKNSLVEHLQNVNKDLERKIRTVEIENTALKQTSEQTLKQQAEQHVQTARSETKSKMAELFHSKFTSKKSLDHKQAKLQDFEKALDFGR